MSTCCLSLAGSDILSSVFVFKMWSVNTLQLSYSLAALVFVDSVLCRI